jgi:hypothetical protein
MYEGPFRVGAAVPNLQGSLQPNVNPSSEGLITKSAGAVTIHPVEITFLIPGQDLTDSCSAGSAEVTNFLLICEEGTIGKTSATPGSIE